LSCGALSCRLDGLSLTNLQHIQEALILFQRHSSRLESRSDRLLRHLFARGLQSVQALLNRLNQFLTGRRFLKLVGPDSVCLSLRALADGKRNRIYG